MPDQKREYWSNLIAEQEVSGLTVRAFCQEQGVGGHSFYYWRKRLQTSVPVQLALLNTVASPAAGTYAIPCGEPGSRRFEIGMEELGALLSGINLRNATRRKRYRRTNAYHQRAA